MTQPLQQNTFLNSLPHPPIIGSNNNQTNARVNYVANQALVESPSSSSSIQIPLPRSRKEAAKKVSSLAEAFSHSYMEEIRKKDVIKAQIDKSHQAMSESDEVKKRARALPPDIGAFYDRLDERGGIRALDRKTRSQDCEKLLEELARVNFEQVPDGFLDNFILTIEKMLYWKGQQLISEETQGVFELFARFCENPLLYKKLSPDSLTRMVNILGTAVKEKSPLLLVDHILKDLNPELCRTLRMNKWKNSGVPNMIMGMAHLDCSTLERVEMFRILIPSIERMKPLTCRTLGFHAVEKVFEDYESLELPDTPEREAFIRVTHKILLDWLSDIRRSKQ